MLSGQKTFSGMAAISITTAMLALTVGINAPSAAKSAETYVYLAEVHYFLPQGGVLMPACGMDKSTIGAACEQNFILPPNPRPVD